mmetsp:Transcript_4464/g.10506  ORF Transcript_4464/g.10506 Transcript_4464/m.10506 type:complete len:211 (+) Transcript_4464:101-733(+)
MTSTSDCAAASGTWGCWTGAGSRPTWGKCARCTCRSLRRCTRSLQRVLLRSKRSLRSTLSSRLGATARPSPRTSPPPASPSSSPRSTSRGCRWATTGCWGSSARGAGRRSASTMCCAPQRSCSSVTSPPTATGGRGGGRSASASTVRRGAAGGAHGHGHGGLSMVIPTSVLGPSFLQGEYEGLEGGGLAELKCDTFELRPLGARGSLVRA